MILVTEIATPKAQPDRYVLLLLEDINGRFIPTYVLESEIAPPRSPAVLSTVYRQAA